MVSWIASAAPKAALVGVLLALGTVPLGPALAQDQRIESMVNRLERMERDLAALSRQVYRGDAPKGAPSGSVGSGPVPGGDYVSRLESRIGELEGQITQMTGNVETLSHTNSELTARIERMSKDYELRFQEIEKGGGSVSASAPRAEAPAAIGPTSGAPPAALGTLNQRDITAGAPKGAQAPATKSASLPQGSPQQQYDYAFGLINKARSDADYTNAAQAFQDFLDKNPSGPLASNARYWMGESYYANKDYGGAARVFLDGYQKDQKGPKAPDSLLKLGMSLTNLDKKKEACATFDKLSKDFPAAANNFTRLSAERKRAGCA